MKLQLFIMCCIAQSIYGNIFDFDPSFDIQPLIMGGEEAEDGYAPYQCSIQFAKNKTHQCGCSIISSNWILTAAQCVRELTPGGTEILVGTNDLTKGGRYYKVDKFVVHEDYEYPKHANDIAVIHVLESIEFNDKVQPIELETEEVSEGTELQFTGWGQLGGLEEYPERLQLLNVNVYNRAKCALTYLLLGGDVGDSHLCAYKGIGQGPCYGDSGSPLVLRDGSNVKLVGILNFGYQCGSRYPNVFASVAYLNDWIKNNAA